MKLAAEGVVLLKNDHDQLPLNSNAVHSVALIGPFAEQAMTGGGGSSHVNPIRAVRPLEGIKKFVGADVSVVEDDGKDITKAVTDAKSVDTVILMLGDRQTEGHDHSIALSDDQNQLAAAVLVANPHTIVVLKTGGPVLMPWENQAPPSSKPGTREKRMEPLSRPFCLDILTLRASYRSHSRSATKIFRFKVLNNIRVLTISLTTPRAY